MARFPSGRPRPLPSADPRDLAYFTKDQAETSVLFELIASYERRSMLVTANQAVRRMGQGRNDARRP
jgi:hypothetical protein